ncbi:MAG: hypothetical protein AVDCRST_MAG78-1048 [uncultured Rubrobacteraceae bacterium]|uniref:Uncharacterized protein n=1 Tax=uncultured Rubrobacteraceae bacterium TaxID=349277 RepID=A0A6J4PMW3_9ACTN|nr:MAG: hypothetical protein AVDCRST_MAG78-1048 [uncultured Rubrobacteraceae bacterium]
MLALIGPVAGLLAAEVLLRLARPLLLLGDFLARYASSLLGVSLGGAIFAALLVSPGALNESPEKIPSRIVIFLEAGAVFGVVGE